MLSDTMGGPDKRARAMKYPLGMNADQLFEVHRGLELRIIECEKMLKCARSGKSRDEWSHQLFCARMALLHV